MSEAKVVHLKRETCDVRIDRATPWGNPFELGVAGNRAEVIQKHLDWLANSVDPATDGKGRIFDPVWVREHLPDLKGKRLGCWCAPKACHGDTLAMLAAEVPSCWDDFPDSLRMIWIKNRLQLPDELGVVAYRGPMPSTGPRTGSLGMDGQVSPISSAEHGSAGS